MIQTDNTARIVTTRFGIVEADRSKIISFVDEIPGFPAAKRFILIPHAEDSPFSWLQSVDMPELAFAVADPWLFFGDYKPVISEGELELLQADSDIEDSIVVLSILTIPGDPYKMTANLQAPIVINSKNNLAKQIILLNDTYTTKHSLLAKS